MTTSSVYCDLISESSRAIVVFCRLHHLPVDVKWISLKKAEHRTPALLALNPLGKVPFLLDDGFCISEACAILTYLARKHASQVPEHWYPTELKAKTNVDAALHWQQRSLRANTDKLLAERVVRLGTGSGNARYEAEANEASKAVQEALNQLEKVWLANTPFMTGKQISLADLLCATIVEQLRLLDTVKERPDFSDMMNPYPKVQAWLQQVATVCKPHFDDVHASMRSSVARAHLTVCQQRGSALPAPAGASAQPAAMGAAASTASSMHRSASGPSLAMQASPSHPAQAQASRLGGAASADRPPAPQAAYAGARPPIPAAAVAAQLGQTKDGFGFSRAAAALGQPVPQVKDGLLRSAGAGTFGGFTAVPSAAAIAAAPAGQAACVTGPLKDGKTESAAGDSLAAARTIAPVAGKLADAAAHTGSRSFRPSLTGSFTSLLTLPIPSALQGFQHAPTSEGGRQSQVVL